MVPEPPLELSLVIPTFNQRARTVQAGREAEAWLRARFVADEELIGVDDGSQTGQRLGAPDVPAGVRVVQHEEDLGKGGVVRSGVVQARGDYVIFTDSDLPFSLEPVPTTLAWLRDGADVVMGDRLLPESEAAIEVGPLRRLSSVVYT